MAECIFCEKNNGYGGYRDGACEHIDNPALNKDDGICKYFAFNDRAQEIVRALPDRQRCYKYLKEHRKK